MVKIYAIKNPINDEVIYVGASLYPEARFAVHRNGSEWHPITYRYKQIRLMKAAKVEPLLIILGETDRENARALEQYWIDHYITEDHGVSRQKYSGYPNDEYQSYIKGRARKYPTK
jgi:predicted GIY-YIG superfamily endonuclease